jgi:hypothetical protein
MTSVIDRMNLDQTLGSLDPGFDWGLEPSTGFSCRQLIQGLGRLDREILHDDQRFNSLDQKARESVEESALVTCRFTLF